MSLRFRNTLGGALEEFQPLDPANVRMYSCGPTVYAPAHIGNFRSFVFADLVRRYLAWKGYRVTWVMNITDVDDKIIRDAAAEGIAIGTLTSRYTDGFLDDMTRLRITRPDAMPRATEHIPEMATLIATLLERGHAYRTDDGSIFFRIASWPAYGTLARLDPTTQRVGERVETDEYDKDDVRDFALWKGPRDGEPSWSTPIGDGRPGWHIECSAMSMRYLGPSFDIHTGGIDLVFPHHEDEIAQSEAATGEPFVRTWLHCDHLRLGGEKMAKRTGRLLRPAEAYAQGWSPRALRYALLAAHYRAPLEFTEDSLVAATSAVERLSTVLAALDQYESDRLDDPGVAQALEAAHDAFEDALDDDLSIAPALAAVFDLVRDLNRRIGDRSLSSDDARRAAEELRDIDQVLAVMSPDDGPAREVSGLVMTLLEERVAARAARDWARSDALRDDLAALGILVEDTRDGQRWRVQEGHDGTA
ncbi:MAG: cysteine--tRNA ligase [Chloroflexi bacterium]|nr:cysteine--tRNA ligase [Chloroflexota bacterium]